MYISMYESANLRVLRSEDNRLQLVKKAMSVFDTLPVSSRSKEVLLCLVNTSKELLISEDSIFGMVVEDNGIQVYPRNFRGSALSIELDVSSDTLEKGLIIHLKPKYGRKVYSQVIDCALQYLEIISSIDLSAVIEKVDVFKKLNYARRALDDVRVITEGFEYAPTEHPGNISIYLNVNSLEAYNIVWWAPALERQINVKAMFASDTMENDTHVLYTGVQSFDKRSGSLAPLIRGFLSMCVDP